MAADLDIYVENLRSFASVREYTLKLLLPGLTKAGLSYRLLSRFDPRDVGCCALVHIDLTDIPDEFARIHASYEKTINGRALTIRRTLYSTAGLKRGAVFDGPVIVKTLLNSGGFPELRYKKNQNLGSRTAHRFRRLLIPHYKERLCPPYTLYKSIGDVPEESWQDERLVVEKFLPGSFDLPVIKYRYCFLHETELNLRTTYDDLLCSSAKVGGNEIVKAVPEAVMEVRSRLNIDFGAIDYFVVDGEVTVIDANKTVTTAQAWMMRYDFVGDYIDRLTQTLVDFVER
jgi:hypothetical protein